MLLLSPLLVHKKTHGLHIALLNTIRNLTVPNYFHIRYKNRIQTSTKKHCFSILSSHFQETAQESCSTVLLLVLWYIWQPDLSNSFLRTVLCLKPEDSWKVDVETDFLNENSAGKDLQGPSQTANVIHTEAGVSCRVRGTIYIRERYLYQGKILIYIFNHIQK